METQLVQLLEKYNVAEYLVKFLQDQDGKLWFHIVVSLKGNSATLLKGRIEILSTVKTPIEIPTFSYNEILKMSQFFNMVANEESLRAKVMIPAGVEKNGFELRDTANFQAAWRQGKADLENNLGLTHKRIFLFLFFGLRWNIGNPQVRKPK